MPALQMFGRRWALAADDVPVLAFPAAIFHLIWFIFLVVAFSAISKPSSCANTSSYEACIIGLFICFFLSAFLESWLAVEGMRGGIFEPEKRSRVVPLLYAQVAVFVCEVGFLIFGTVLISRQRPPCLEQGRTLWHSRGVVDVIIWTTWGVLAAMAGSVFATYSFFPQYNSQKSWERRCRFLALCMCCSTRMAGNRGGPGTQADQPDPVGRMSELFAQVFEHVDMVTTDILATFLMAAAAQQCKRRAAVGRILAKYEEKPLKLESSSSQPPSLMSARSSTNLRELKPTCSSTRLLTSTSSSVSQLSHTSDSNHMDRLERHGKEAGLTACPHGGHEHLLTPSGVAAEHRPDWTPQEAAVRQGPSYEEVNPTDLGEAAHFCRFAFAAYGYMLYIWSRPQMVGWCQLCCGRHCSCWTSPVRRYMQVMLSDQRKLPDISELKVTNHMNREAIQQMTALPDRDVVFVRFQNEALSHSCLPYFIAIDEHSHSVVVSIRGTLSLEDCVTDFMCEPVDLDEWIKEVDSSSQPKSFAQRVPDVKPATRHTKASGHSGILESAKAVVEDLQSTGVLEGLMLHPPVPGARVQRDCRGWRLVVTGHSLGAGASVLVALYLRNFFPKVKCWAFAPPGGLADPHVAEAAQEFCTSVLLGKDWIPRLTVHSFERLRDEMITAAVRCKQSKLRFFFGALYGKKWREDELFHPQALVQDRADELLQRYNTSSQGGNPRRNRYEQARDFVPPGRLMFLRPIKSAAKERKSNRKYMPVWITAQELKREGVLISPRMMADHMPDYLTAVLQRLAEQVGQGVTQQEAANGDVTISIPPSPHVSPHRGRGSSMENILRNSLVSSRAFVDDESNV
ncbi:hypothetical protein ABBQ32_012435 [Trebouxia sp. C0010 RCD-2024]